MGAATKVVENASSSVESAGAAIGTGVGAMMIISGWGIGVLILGMLVLFMRPKV
jgi:hypothetical protein